MQRRRVTIDYFYVLIVGDGVKYRPRLLIRYHVGREMNTGGHRGSFVTLSYILNGRYASYFCPTATYTIN
jgi:hypothetical protein